jgi:cellulose synthase/poly-beta-1,6-N-acetylglucosamine synthase-like glycosyltransferase
MNPPVSIVIPMYNAERHIKKVLGAVLEQDYPGPIEVIVVNDGSTDGSLEVVEEIRKTRDFKIMDQKNQGAVTATNNGFRAASHDIIFSIDSDVVLTSDWLKKIIEEFRDPGVGAVQGYYKTPKGVSFWARMMGYDVEARYDSIGSRYVTQVCTGDTAYRKDAIDKVGLFDPAFRYGYDNDMSYRLVKAGYKLVFRKDALCDHYWKEDIKGYMKQQYHSAYGRMQLVRKHTERVFLFFVSGAALTLAFSQHVGRYLNLAALGVFGALFIDRVAFAAGVFKKQKDPAAILLPFVHLLRNVVWSWAFLVWVLRGKRV